MRPLSALPRKLHPKGAPPARQLHLHAVLTGDVCEGNSLNSAEGTHLISNGLHPCIRLVRCPAGWVLLRGEACVSTERERERERDMSDGFLFLFLYHEREMSDRLPFFNGGASNNIACKSCPSL